MNRSRSNQWDDDEPSYDEDDERYDDSQGYSDDGDEEEEYQEFLEREFGVGAGSPKRSRWQFWTAVVLLVSFAFPLVSYLLWAIWQ